MTPWYVWAFDGVGGAAVVAAGVAVYQRYSARKRANNKSPAVTTTHSLAVVESPGSLILTAPVTDSPVAMGNNIRQLLEVHHHYAEITNTDGWTPTEPTPTEIFEEIEAVLPFDREHAREKYEGLKVSWETSVVNVGKSPDPDMEWFVLTSFPAGCRSFQYVYFLLSSVTPEFRAVTQGSVVRVHGIIRSVDGSSIFLMSDPRVQVVKRLPNARTTA
jgi:hypothetical protein